jgi:hypothetical protein
MKIIDNLNNNHNLSIQKILLKADHLLMVSPFLTEDFDEFIYESALIGIKKITLITTLKDNSTDLFKKANSMYSFCFSCVSNNLIYEIRIDNKLHGKLYIALKNNNPTIGIITSANFTVNGLSYSHEWGIQINDSKKLQKIIDDLYKVSSLPLTQIELNEIVKTIDEYASANPPVKENKPKLKVSDLMKKKFTDSQKTVVKSDIRYFLKPVGSSDQPFSEERVISPGLIEMQFSKRKPSAVRSGDILICYGVGSTKILGQFKVLSDPTHINDDMERWPWRVNAQNITPDYSNKWATYDNTLSRVQSSYGSNKILTYVGGKSLGALNFGADKIRLNEEFAKHLINIINKDIR